MSKHLSHSAGQFGAAHHLQAQFVALPEYGTAPEDVLVPSYWMHYARRLTPGAFIRVMPEGMTWIGDYVVIACDEYTATLKLVHMANLSDQAIKKDKAADFKIDRVSRWVRVIRKADDKVVRGNFTSEQDAQKWLAENTEG